MNVQDHVEKHSYVRKGAKRAKNLVFLRTNNISRVYMKVLNRQRKPYQGRVGLPLEQVNRLHLIKNTGIVGVYWCFPLSKTHTFN